MYKPNRTIEYLDGNVTYLTKEDECAMVVASCDDSAVVVGRGSFGRAGSGEERKRRW